MEKVFLVFFLASCILLTGCSVSPSGDSGEEVSVSWEEPEVDPEVDAHNTLLLCDALSFDEDHRSISYLLYSLNYLKIGKAQKISQSYHEGWFTLEITAEDGTRFRMYLNSNKTADAVENLDTGEWPIFTIR